MHKHGWRLAVLVYGWSVALMAKPDLVDMRSLSRELEVPYWCRISVKLAVDRKHKVSHSASAKRAVVKMFRDEALVKLNRFGVTNSDLGNYLSIYIFTGKGDSTKTVLVADLKNEKFSLDPVKKNDTLHLFSPTVHESVYVAEGKLVVVSGDPREETIKVILSSDGRKDVYESELANIEINLERLLKESGFSIKEALNTSLGLIGLQKGNYSDVPWLKTYGKVMGSCIQWIDDIKSVSMGLEVENGFLSLNAELNPKPGSSFQKFALANGKRSIGSLPFVPDDAMFIFVSNIQPESMAEWEQMRLEANISSQPLSMPEQRYLIENYYLTARNSKGLTTFAICQIGEEQVGATLYFETEKSGLMLERLMTENKILLTRQAAVERENDRRMGFSMQHDEVYPSPIEFSTVLSEGSEEALGPFFAGLHYTTESRDVDLVHLFTRHSPSEFLNGYIIKTPLACFGAVDSGILATFGDQCQPALVKYLDGYRHNIAVENVIKGPVMRCKEPILIVKCDIGALYANAKRIIAIMDDESKGFQRNIFQNILGDENSNVTDEAAHQINTLGAVSFEFWAEKGNVDARFSLSEKTVFTIQESLKMFKEMEKNTKYKRGVEYDKYIDD